MKLAAPLTTVALLALPAATISATIDFEGLALAEGTVLSVLPGHPSVSFTNFKLVLPGAPTVAFNGNSSGSGAGGADNANTGATAANTSAAIGATFTISFAQPTGGLSLHAVDVEVGSVTESVEFRVFDVPAGGTPIHIVVLTGGDPGTGDGLATLVPLTGFAGDATVRRVDIRRIAGPIGTNPGWAIDNINYSDSPVSVEPTSWARTKGSYRR